MTRRRFRDGDDPDRPEGEHVDHAVSRNRARSVTGDPVVGSGIGRPRTDPLATAAGCATLDALDAAVITCNACPRLVRWREEVAATKRASFRDEQYWGRPVSGFGPSTARIAVIGLAPAAHGGNRTGRVFTGDRSGDFLFAAMHRVGLANQAQSVGRDDGLTLRDTRVMAAVRCAPPANAPTPLERDTCAPWLKRELALLPGLRVVVALGAFGWQAALAALADLGGLAPPRPKPAFAHARRIQVGAVWLLGCYHPSQQNTFTGRLTEAMLDEVLGTARRLARHPDRDDAQQNQPSHLPTC